MSKKFVFTTKNLIRNIDKLGAWSAYGLAADALHYYFPKEYRMGRNVNDMIIREGELCVKLGCDTWQDVIVKYHKEVGYKPKNGIFNPKAVNRF